MLKSGENKMSKMENAVLIYKCQLCNDTFEIKSTLEEAEKLMFLVINETMLPFIMHSCKDIRYQGVSKLLGYKRVH